MEDRSCSAIAWMLFSPGRPAPGACAARAAGAGHSARRRDHRVGAGRGAQRRSRRRAGAEAAQRRGTRSWPSAPSPRPDWSTSARRGEPSSPGWLEYLDQEQQHQMVEIARRRQLYRGGRPRTARNRSVVVTDDGVATGSTLLAALQAAARADAAGGHRCRASRFCRGARAGPALVR